MNLLDFVFPPQCGACGRIGHGLCDACMPRQSIAVRRVGNFEIVALTRYDAPARRAIHALKDGRRDVARAFAQRFAPMLAPDEILVPVPTTPARRRVRGMDGVVEIATRAAAQANASVLDVLECVTGDHQRGKTRTERLASFGRFRCSPIVSGVDVTLVDDVCTTGTTLEDCASAIRAAGGRVRRALVIALVDYAPQDWPGIARSPGA